MSATSEDVHDHGRVSEEKSTEAPKDKTKAMAEKKKSAKDRCQKKTESEGAISTSPKSGEAIVTKKLAKGKGKKTARGEPSSKAETQRRGSKRQRREALLDDSQNVEEDQGQEEVEHKPSQKKAKTPKHAPVEHNKDADPGAVTVQTKRKRGSTRKSQTATIKPKRNSRRLSQGSGDSEGMTSFGQYNS